MDLEVRKGLGMERPQVVFRGQGWWLGALKVDLG